MKTNASIYIAGHTGLIGSAVIRKFQSAGYNNLLVASHNELELTDSYDVERFFVKNQH